MYAWEQIQITLEAIEQHIDEDISIMDLANKASLSPFYYQRLFRRLVKKPVAEYIKLRRNALAIDALLDEKKRILDVALELGFSSHEQFSRSFKETFAMTPSEYRKNPTMLSRMNKPELSLQYTLVEEGVPLISEGVVLEISRKTLSKPESLVGLIRKAPISFIEGQGVDSGVDPLLEVWETFHNEKAQLSCILPQGDEFGITYASEEEGYFQYFAGAQANKEAIPTGYQAKAIPVGEYIVCSFEAENFESLVMDALYKATQYLYQIWLPKHQIGIEAFSVERYCFNDTDMRNMEVWVKPITQEKEQRLR